ncbi:hypothetical protein [Crocosphaera sp. Alani8]|uniref:hypothetical protein n=1 Tax=Crocosphaera sp. Alani8 TaxID=3038952 RepID=UPI00313C8F56
MVYVSNSGTENDAPGEGVVVFDPEGNNLGFFETGDPFDIRAYNGALLINNIDEDNIERYTIEGIDSTFIDNLVDSDGETGINFPQQMTVRESNGNLLVGGFTNIPDFNNGGLYEYDALGNQVNLFNADDGFADRLRAGYELGNGNIIWSGGDGVIVTDPVTGEDEDIYTVNTLDFRPGARYIEQLVLPKEGTLDLTGAVFLGDQRLDKIFLNQDLNGDGDANDPLEVSVYFDETNASGLTDPTGNVFTIFQSDSGAVFYGDGDSDSVYLLFDGNLDGDALDPGEAVVWFTDSQSTPLPTPNGVAQGGDGAIYIVNAGTGSSPEDRVYRTVDLNGDNDALDEGESSVWLDLQILNPSSSAFDIEFIGDVAYISDLVGGDDDLIYRVEDLDGNGTISANEANIFIQDGNPFGVPLDFGIAVDEESVYTWESLDTEGPQSVYRLQDQDGSGDINAANEAIEVWNTDALPSGFNSFSGFSIAVGPDKELVVTSNGGESENNLFRLVDSNMDGDYFDDGETIIYLAQSVTGTTPERARAVEYALGRGPEVSFTLDPEVAIETDGTVLTFNFTLDKAPPPEGTVVILTADEQSSINRIDLSDVSLNGIDLPRDISPDLDFDELALNITEQFASFSAPLLNTPEDTDLNGDGVIEDFGDVAEQVTWGIRAIAPEDVPEGFGTPGVISKSSLESILIADNAEQLQPPPFVPDFGTIDGETIEVEGSNALVFAGGGNDFVDSSLSDGENRIYLQSGEDIAILGQGDRILGGVDDDQFFVTSGGDNTITGGQGSDQFWIATGDLIVNVFEIEANDAYYTFRDQVSDNSDARLLSDKATAIGFPESFQSVSFLNFEGLPVSMVESGLISAELKLEYNPALAETLIPATEDRPVSVSTYGLVEGSVFNPVNGNLEDINYGVDGSEAISEVSVGDEGIYHWDVTALVADELTNPSDDDLSVVLSGVFGNVDIDERNSYAAFYPVGATEGLAPTLIIETEGINTITDFTIGEDVIGIAGLGIGFDGVELTQLGDDALIGVGGNDFALLLNIDINDLSDADFAFG